MWSYYGSKANIIQFYPKPKHDRLIEPMVGSGRYALKYFDRDVLIMDKYDVVIRIWKWLQQCSPQDILQLPRQVNVSQTLDDFTFDCDEAKLLMGFLVAYGIEKPRIKPTNKQKFRPNFINFSLQRIAKNLFKIKHWKIEHGSYESIPNQTATWFIDPPYQRGGECYPESSKNINFSSLREWCMSRGGQVIVCENNKAEWMDFKPLITQKTRTGLQKEVFWTNEFTSIGVEQLSLQI